MAVTLIASRKPSRLLPGVTLDQSRVGDWLRSIPTVKDWLGDYADQTVHVVAWDRRLPDELAEHSLTVPCPHEIDQRLRDERGYEET